MGHEKHLTFAFVNVSHPDEIRDKRTQRLVRRQAMREIGKSRRKPTREPTWTFALRAICTTPSPSASLNLGSEPVEMNPRARELVHFSIATPHGRFAGSNERIAVHADADYSYRPFRKIWFSMALRDGSAFTLCLANASMFREEARHPASFRYEACEEALTYYGCCVRQVTERLSDPTDCTSEGVITTILGLICHDVCPPRTLIGFFLIS